MVIGVDAGALSVNDDRLKVGVHRVTREALFELVRIDEENEYRLYSFGRGIGPTSPKLRGVKEILLPRVGWSKVWLPIELKKRPVDVFLGFAQALPYSKTSYNIGFIYDLGFLYHPEAYGMSAKTLTFQTDTLVRRADHIVTISHTTKTDLTREYGLSHDNITVAYPGVDNAFSPAGEKYVGPNPYVLFVGSLNKAKDIPALLCTFGRFLKKIKIDSGSRAGMTNQLYDLYLIGGDYWPDPEIEKTIEILHLDDRVKKIGFVPDEELPKYYRGATAFVTTALREGFCLPAAEAMACGTPVVAVDRGALSEVVGNGGIIVKTQIGFARALIQMTDNKTREKYAKNATLQAKKFRWEEFAQHILQCMHI